MKLLKVILILTTVVIASTITAALAIGWMQIELIREMLTAVGML